MTQNLEAIRRFLLGGIAVFTLVSKKSGDRKTFRVRAAEDVDGSGRPHGYYVDLLIGPNNEEDFTYLCYLYEGRDTLRIKSKLFGKQKHPEAESAFRWMITFIETRNLPNVQKNFEAQAEFFHAGRCSRCNRTLTDPESIELGIGPVCRAR